MQIIINNQESQFNLANSTTFLSFDKTEDIEQFLDKNVQEYINPIYDNETTKFLFEQPLLNYNFWLLQNNGAYSLNFIDWFSTSEFLMLKFKKSYFSIEVYDKPDSGNQTLLSFSTTECFYCTKNTSTTYTSSLTNINWSSNSFIISFINRFQSKLEMINTTQAKVYVKVRFFYADANNPQVVEFKNSSNPINYLSYNQIVEYVPVLLDFNTKLFSIIGGGNIFNFYQQKDL